MNSAAILKALFFNTFIIIKFGFGRSDIRKILF